jgi:hypothetical protein
MESPIPVKISDKLKLQNIYNILKPESIIEIVLFILLMTSIYVITALIFYNQIQLDINTKSQCYLSRKAVTSTGAFTATAQNGKGNSLYTVSYDMPSKSYSVDCSCPSGSVTNTYPNVDVYNLQTQKTMRITNKVCGCDKQYYTPGYDQIYFSGYPGVTRFMNTASLISETSNIQSEADTSFFQAALNPKQYYNTY